MGILTEDMRRVVETSLGFIATVCPDGTPNLSPKGTTAVWDDDHLVFADLRSPGTISNLRANPSIEINVVDQLVRKGYRFKGTGKVHTEGDVFERGVQFYEARGTVKARERVGGIVIVAVEQALPVTSPAYDIGLTEDEVRELSLRRLGARLAESEEAIPVLRVADAATSVAWYARLGWVEEWVHRFEPSFPAFVSIARHGVARLFLSEHRGDASPDTLVYVRVNDVDAVATLLGLAVEEQPWAREIGVEDPDGNRLRIGTPRPAAGDEQPI